jgi:hypothetical protein
MKKEELWDLVCDVNNTQILSKDDKWMSKCDWEEFILLMSLKTPQSYGSLIQNRIIKQLKGEKVKASLNKGDILINKNYCEIKSSILTHSNNVLNLVQIRPWQELSGYFCFAFDIRYTRIFNIHQYFLTHGQMMQELSILGQSAHGTKVVTAKNTHNEKAIRINVSNDDSNFKRWEHSYKINVL